MKRAGGRRKGMWEMSSQSPGAPHPPACDLRPALASQLWEFNQEAGENGAEEDGLKAWAGDGPRELGSHDSCPEGTEEPSP